MGTDEYRQARMNTDEYGRIQTGIYEYRWAGMNTVQTDRDG